MTTFRRSSSLIGLVDHVLPEWEDGNTGQLLAKSTDTSYDWVDGPGGVSLTAFGAVGDGVTDDTTAVQAAEASGSKVDGNGLTYYVTALPTDFGVFTNASFLLASDSINYITKDFFDSQTSKISNSTLYTAWPQDKCYKMNHQIRVWANEARSHQDAQQRPVVFASDDGGITYREGEILDETVSNTTLWCAGTDGTNEYIIERVGTASPFTYQLWRRPVPSGASGNYDLGDWDGSYGPGAITFPNPTEAGEPDMIHSFAAIGSGDIVVGFHYGTGAAGIARSTDSGATWTSYNIAANTEDYEEVTVAVSGTTIAGFMRAGTSAYKPQFWSTTVATIGTFSRADLRLEIEDTPIPLDIDSNGNIHAFMSWRSGTQESNPGGDGPTSAYYLTGALSDVVTNGDSSLTYYRLGTLFHAETGGASAVGVGSVVVYEDSVHLFYSSGERTGDTNTLNRVANIYQTVLPLSVRDGLRDYRDRINLNGSGDGKFRKLPGGNGYALISRLSIINGEIVSAAYGNVPSEANDLVIDVDGSNGGASIASDSSLTSMFLVGPTEYGGIQQDETGPNLRLYAGSSARWRVDGANSYTFAPESDNAYDIGRSARRVREVFAVDATIENTRQIRSDYENILTIASGVITIANTWHPVDTEASAATDDLDTINGGARGDILILSAASSSRTVVVKDNTGNIRCGADFSLDSAQDRIMLQYDGSVWCCISTSNNA